MARLVLVGAVAALLVGVFFLGDVSPSRAQTEALVDYDLDNDGLIEVRTRNQLQAIHYDLNGDGTPENRGSYRGISANWVTSFPNAMPGAGCPPRDHDNDPATDAVASCIGYELIADIDASGVWNPIGKTGANANWEGFNTRLVGNGFRVYNGPNIRRNFGNTQSRGAFIAIIEPQASVEGLGIHGARVDLEDGHNAAMTVLLRGKIIGSYLQDGIVGRNSNAAFAVSVQTGATYAGLIAHSYVNGWDTDLSGSVGGNSVGGLVSNFQAQNGDNQARCVNSYFSGDIDALSTYISGKDKGLIAHSVGSGTQLENCYGDNSRDNNTQRAWQSASGTENSLYTRSAAQLKAPTGYSGPFEHWDDYDANGNRLGEVGPRTDFWEFGDETQYPTLKAWGHDRTLPPDRSLSGAATVNLCTRNLAVANEIIRHLKDNVRRTGVATTPAAVMALSPCQSSTDTQEVSITNLTDLVVTSAAHPFNLRPDRTFPESPKLTTLDRNDFAYLTNAAHFDLSGNALESLPPRLFHGIPLRWLDLSQNELTSLPPDLFEGVAAVTETTGNSLQLAGNSLTDTGLSGRVFDPLSHLNGLDLSDNALTRINIRWFERLNNLGRVGSEFTPGLGLHLAGNTVTEHHYTAKILTGIRDDIVQYTGSTADATLRQAILTAMQAANSSIANVDIGATTTSFYATTLAGSAAATADRGYQPGTVTSCAGTTGPDRYDYVGGVTPDCYLQAHWSPPHKSADTAASAPGISTSGSRGTVRADWTHTASASFVSYQLRSRPTASDAWTPWLIAPITLASGAKSVTAAAPESGVGYTVQLRVITTTGPPSAPIDGTATTTPANWLSGFTAVTSTSAAGFITLNWTAVRLSDLPSGHSVAEYFYRYKLSSATVYGAWRSAGAGTRHTIAGTELTAGATYNVQLVGGIDDTDADAGADYFTNRAAATAAAYTVPSSLSASSGTDPGTISLTWMRQMAFTHAQTRFQVRRKPRGAAWAGAEWIDVPDSTGTGGDSDTDTHNETGYMLTGLRGGVEYDIQVRLLPNDTDGPLSPAGTTGTATAVPAPTTFTATSGAAGALTLAWATQTATSDGQAGYEMRYRYTGGAWTQWADIAGSTHSDTGHTLTGLLNNRSVEVALRFRWNNAVRTSAAVAATGTTGAVAAPTVTATAAHGAVTLSWLQQTATTNTEAKYQLRYKKAAESYPATGSLGWADIPNSSHSTNSHTVTDLDAGSYNFEVRFFWSEAIGAGAAGMATQSKTGIAAPTGLNATAATGPGRISLAWTIQSAVTVSGTHYEFRHRVSGTSWPESGGWADIPGSGSGTTGYTFSSRNNSTIEVELRLVGVGPGAAASASVTTNAVARPTSLTATAGAASIALSWPAQSATTGSSAKYQVRYKKSTESWPTTGSLGWADIPSSSHSSTSHTLTGLEAVSYNVEVRFLWSPAVGTSAARSATATPTAFPTLTSVTAETGDLPYGIDVSWDAQSVVTTGGFQVRRTNWAKSGWGAWTDVPDGNDADMHTYDETEFTINAERTNWSTDVEVRYVIGTNVGPATRVSNVISGFLPKGYTARPGSTPGSIIVSWTRQDCGATAGHFIRSHRAVGDPWPTGSGRWSGAIPPIPPNMGNHNATGYTLTGLTPGREYEMRVTGNVCDGWYFEHAQPTAKARAAPVPAPQNLMASTTSSEPAAVALSWDVQTDAQGAQARYQVRHKKTADSWPATGEFGWADIPSSTHATTSHTVRALDPVSYDFEVRFVWDNTFGWSAATSVTATPAAGIAAPANLAATPSAVPGSVDLTWDQQTARTTATTKFQVRYKATDETAWGTWADIPDSTDSGTDTHDETGYTVTGLGSPRRFYDFEVRLEVGDNPGSFARLNRIRAGYQPRGLTARTGTAPGTIDVSWDLQTANQAAAAQFATRNKFAPQNWPAGGSGWINIGDQADADSDSHNEVGYQYTGLMPGVLYDIVVSFTPDGTNYTHIPSLQVVQARAGIVPAPTNFRATTATSPPGAIVLSWDQQTASSNAASKHQYRVKRTSESWPTTGDEGWTDIGDGSDTNSHTYDESSVTVPGLAGAEHDVQLRFFWTTALGASAEVRAMATASTGPTPTGFTATTSQNIGEVDLSWDLQTAQQGSNAKFQVRAKPSDENTWPAAWTDVPDSTGTGGDSDTDAHNETGYTVTGLDARRPYDFQMRLAVGNFGGPIVEVTNKRAGYYPRELTATTGTTPGTIDLSWMQQSVYQASTTTFLVRFKPSDEPWPANQDDIYHAVNNPYGWRVITDSDDADLFQHDEDSYQLINLRSGVQYDVNVSFTANATVFTHRPSLKLLKVRAGAVPVPANLTATAEAVSIALSWDAQTATNNSQAKYQVRYKKRNDNWPTSTGLGWADISGSNHATDSHHILGLDAGDAYDVELRFHYNDVVGASAATATVSATPTAIAALTGFTAGPGNIEGLIDPRWDQQTQSTSPETVIQIRARQLDPTGSWIAWFTIPDSTGPSGDAGTHRYDETTSAWISGYQQYRPVEVQIRLKVGTAEGPVSTVARAHAGYWPRNLSATAGTVPGTIQVTWDEQTSYTGTNNRFRIRHKASSSSTWGSWTEVPDNSGGTTDTGTHRYDETQYTITGLTAGTDYDIGMGFWATSFRGFGSDNWHPTVTNIDAAIVLPPVNFNAATSTGAAGAVDLSWDAQTASMLAASKFQYRYKIASATWGSQTWNDVDDGGTSVGDSDASHYNETGVTVTGLTAGTSYSFQLRFLWNATHGNSTSVAATATASAVPTPDNFSATAGTDPGSIDLAWDVVIGVTKYQYRYRTGAAAFGSWTDVPDSNGDSDQSDETSLTITMGLTAGTSYDFEFKAVASGNRESPVATATATAQTQSPPTSFSASTGTNPGEIALTWGTPAGGTPTGFEYRYKRANQAAYPATWEDVPDNPGAGDPDTDRNDERAYTITSLWAGVSYNVQIRTESAIGPSEPGASTTATATAQVVAAPTGFSASTAEAPGAIDLAWTAISTGLPDSDVVVNYQYRYKLNSATSFPTTGAGSWTNMPTANTTSFRVAGLNTYEAYDVDIRAAINDNDEGTATTAEYYSAAASDTNKLSGLAAPDNLRAAGGTAPGQVTLNWNAQTTFGTGFTAAKYQYRTRIASPTATWPSGGGWTDVPSSTRTTATYTIPNLMNGQLHDIELRFVPSGMLTGGPSSVQGTPTIVAVPTGFTASTATATAGAISLTWTAQVDGTSSEAKYQYRRKLTSTGGPTVGWPATAPYGWTDIGDGSDADSNAYNENSLTFTGLNAGTSYHVQLRFHWSDAIGASAAAATQTASASNVPIPGTFAASSGSAPGSINLTWAAVTDASYQYRYKLATTANYPTSGAGSWASAGSGTSYTIMGLTNAESYHVQLRAVVSGSSSQPTPTRTAQAQSQPGPRNFAAAQGTNAGELALSWLAPMQGSPTRYDYRYKRATQATSAYSNWASAGTGTSFTVTSLWAGVSYDVQLIAVTAVGNSLPVTATQTAQELAAPGSLAGTIGDNPGEIDITWNAITSGLPTGDTVVQYQYRTKLPSASWPTTAPLGWVNIPAASTTSHTITGLTSGTQYDVQLRAAVADGTEGTATTAEYHSDPATAASSIYSGLARPANLRATASTTVPGSIVLQWNQQSAFTAGTEKYEFRRKLTDASWPAGGGWADVPSSTHSTTGHTLTDLTNGEDYNIEVRFYHSSTLGSSAATAVVGTASSIAVPTGFTATRSTTTAGAIDLRWNAQTAVTVSTALFQVRTRPTTQGASWSTWAPVPDDTSADDPDTDQHDETRHTLTGLTADQQYNIELRLFMSTAIGASNAATASATASSVPVPTGLDATTGSGAGEIDVTWTAVIGATSYQYRYKLESVTAYPTTGTGSWATTTAATSQTIGNLSGGEWYNVQVRALVTGIGESQPTTAVRAQAQTTPGPATLTFSHGPNPGDIKIDWTAPAMNAPVEHYEYRYKLETASTYPSTGTGSWAEVLDSGDLGTLQSDETTYTISGLQAGVSYHVQFRVYASSAIGYSLPQRGTQTARPVPPPTSFMASGGGDPGEVDLQWTAPTGVTILRYELRHRQGAPGAWTGAWSSWTSAGTATTYTYTTLLAGMPRTFEVRAVMQTVGASAPVSTTGTPTPVPTPASFTATTGVFPGEIDISWMAVTGATSYEYRYTLSSNVTWPDDATWQSVAATVTSTTITLLDEGAAYTVEVRAAITNVGKSTMVARGTASARGATFMDQRPNVPAIHAAYAVDAAAIPGRIAIDLPGGTDPFIYRHRTVNPGQWSRWFKVTPQASQNQFLIPDLTPGVEYEIQVRAYTGMTTGFTTALTAEAQAAPLLAAEDFTAGESSGVILLQWSSPALYTPDYYEYRTKPTGTQTWSEWVRVDHEGDRGSTQRRWVTGLESGISHDFELRMQTGAGPSPIAKSSGSARLRIAEVHSIRPTVREVSVRVGDTIALTVDIYDGQEVLDNSIPGKPGSKLVFRWEDKLADGSAGSAGGTFATPNNGRRVTYTAPSSPGRYIVTAEAQPDGVCTSHHEGAAEITDAEREQCTATFTIRVSGIPAVPVPRPDPVDPTGAIPTSMTDDKGGTYTVFTPTKGGTFTGDDITVTAPAGAIPDRTVVGIGATTSDIPTPAPIPGATMSLAGSYYDINAIADNGEPPIPSYTLNEPATACLPFPQEFRADLSNVVVVQRKSTGDLSILSTKIRSLSGDLTVCGTLTQLPATVAVARLGLVPAPTQTTPTTPADTPDTGATAPSTVALLLTLLTGLVVLTGISRIRRIIL